MSIVPADIAYISEFAYFFFHSWLRDWTLKRLSRNAPKPVIQLSTSLELILGALAGAFAQIFTIPVAVIATRQQLHVSEDGAAAPGLLETAREIIAEHGLTGLWMGLKPGLVLTVNPAITYGVFERVKGILVATQVAAGAEARLTPGRSFAIGVLSKTLATVVTYPYIFVSTGSILGCQNSYKWRPCRCSRQRSGFRQGRQRTCQVPERRALLSQPHRPRTQQTPRRRPRSPTW